jgi:protease secretion system outer membrane protein
LNVPINAGTFYQSEIASARITQAQLGTLDVRQKLELEIDQNYADISSGLNEVNIRLRAIDAAELSRKATEKSYQGGVRTRLDVLNTVQTVFLVKEQYINSVVDLAVNYLRLSNMTAQPPAETISELQLLLF